MMVIGGYGGWRDMIESSRRPSGDQHRWISGGKYLWIEARPIYRICVSHTSDGKAVLGATSRQVVGNQRNGFLEESVSSGSS